MLNNQNILIERLEKGDQSFRMLMVNLLTNAELLDKLIKSNIEAECKTLVKKRLLKLYRCPQCIGTGFIRHTVTIEPGESEWVKYNLQKKCFDEEVNYYGGRMPYHMDIPKYPLTTYIERQKECSECDSHGYKLPNSRNIKRQKNKAISVSDIDNLLERLKYTVNQKSFFIHFKRKWIMHRLESFL